VSVLPEGESAFASSPRDAGSSVRSAHPRDVEYSNLSPIARTVWFLLCDHRDKSTNEAYPGKQTLARRSGRSLRTIQRGVRELLEKGWICLTHGDAGGRPSKNRERRAESRVRYHLHPDGQPCALPQPELKQRCAAPVANAKRAAKRAAKCEKDDSPSSFRSEESMTTAHENDDNMAKKDDSGNRAHKEGTPRANHHEETTTSSLAREADTCCDPPFEKEAAGAADKLSQTVIDGPLDLSSFEMMERNLRGDMWAAQHPTQDKTFLLRQPPRLMLDGAARSRIKRGITGAGHTLDHLTYLAQWATLRKARNPIGVLIKIAEDFENRARGVQWPACFLCADSGSVDVEGLGRPCSCRAGAARSEAARAELEATRAEWEAARIEGDVRRKREEHSQLERREAMERLEIERKAREQQLQERQKEQQKLEECHTCPSCEGRSKLEGTWCDACKATGEYRSDLEWGELGKCWLCCGTGKIKLGKRCHLCHASKTSFENRVAS
jgi:helix-turn-helix protein